MPQYSCGSEQRGIYGHNDQCEIHRNRWTGTCVRTGDGIVGDGVNDHRVKLTRVLNDDDWGTLVVEHKDRLTRVGFEWFRVLLARQGKRIVVANEADDDRSDLMADFTSIIYSFAARLYGLRGAKERTKRTVHAFTGENKR